MTVQVVRPAGAGHETLYVLLCSLLIVALASLVVSLHAETDEYESVASDQLDARRDLSPAEQGIYADLRIAYEEIQTRRHEDDSLLTPADLADEGFPPFIDDASATTRGAHQWQLLQADTAPAYLGLSQDAETAGSFLLFIDMDGTAESTAQVWLNRSSAVSAPADLGEHALTEAGWKQVVAQFDAGVTRQHRH
ncbi:MAG: DUF6162 family protein [Pseudomonas sp.]|uniref:DUF6162 family protein n=1 Tax=Pseudomonas sp. TaxID=306 RepID=UPI003D09B3A5